MADVYRMKVTVVVDIVTHSEERQVRRELKHLVVDRLNAIRGTSEYEPKAGGDLPCLCIEEMKVAHSDQFAWPTQAGTRPWIGVRTIDRA